LKKQIVPSNRQSSIVTRQSLGPIQPGRAPLFRPSFSKSWSASNRRVEEAGWECGIYKGGPDASDRRHRSSRYGEM